MRNQRKVQLYSAVFILVVGAGLLIRGFIVAPLGVIDSSVLISFGEIMTFVGAIFGIDYTYKYRNDKITYQQRDKKDE